ncbi:hypothetical protein J18TS1_05100 [Oceanobacillus oncorhynchi subsp. incaldanensis]|nr:hypothetical protein J18TS1_05100 [Oceanobacillus oncorhynchi subsp. incaldanensis]
MGRVIAVPFRTPLNEVSLYVWLFRDLFETKQRGGGTNDGANGEFTGGGKRRAIAAAKFLF